MPSGGQTTDQLVILQWEKKIGDFVRRGDILFEIETDKANLSVESYAEGTLLEIKHGDGTQVKVGEIVAYIGSPDDKLPSGNDKNEPSQENSQLTHNGIHPEKIAGNNNPIAPPEGTEIYASPLARSYARKENIDLADVARFTTKTPIKKDDVTKYLSHLINNRKTNNNDDNRNAITGDSYFVEVSPMRRAIAKRMKESVSVAPHYFVSVDIDITEVIALRKKLNDNMVRSQVRISYHDIIMKAVAKTIEWHPLINSTFLEDKIEVHRKVNFGLAVAVEEGLVVPVVNDVNTKSLGEVARENTGNIEKARLGKLRTQDMSGGTITLSNLGMYGMKEFTAIINQPESCILAVGSILEKPVSINRKAEVRDIMNITASFDHRVVDGATGAAFLQEVKRMLENPHMLMR